MCGIFFIQALGNKPFSRQRTQQFTSSSDKIRDRGPDNTTITYDDNTFMCFQRLKVNDLTDAGNQPMFIDETFLLCNGEIYNHQHIESQFGLVCDSQSDCESVLRFYLKLKDNVGIKDAVEALPECLDGEFAFVIYDKAEGLVHICRDPYGVRPLFWYHSPTELGVCSELKGLAQLSDDVTQFPPGHIATININTSEVTWYNYKGGWFNPDQHERGTDNEAQALESIHNLFTDAVTKRLMSDRPICSLLSGGLDSSLVASIIADHIAPNKLTTFSIGLEGSTDLYYAQKVADHIGSIHHTITLKEEDFLNAIEETIKVIESYDITTVRASVGNYLVSKYIGDNTDFKVVYNGDYSDEVCGGYMYFKKAPSEQAFHDECCRLVQDICYFDSLRSDRTISSQGLEARVPFSDRAFVEYYLSIAPKLRMSHDKIEKYLLRKAFDHTNLLPSDVLWRSKVAFSDGVSKQERSWHNIIKEYIDTKVTDEEYHLVKDSFTHNTPHTKEAYYYRKVFTKHYPKCDYVIPYFWLPKWCGNMTDPSARELEFYEES